MFIVEQGEYAIIDFGTNSELLIEKNDHSFGDMKGPMEWSLFIYGPDGGRTLIGSYWNEKETYDAFNGIIQALRNNESVYTLPKQGEVWRQV